MTPAHIINTLIFVIPCFSLLLLTFQDEYETPALAKIALAILAFLAISFYGSYTYNEFRESPMKFVIIALAAMILGAVIFNLISKYHFRHSIFIVAIAKCYSDHIIFLAMYIYFLIHGKLPAYTTFQSLGLSLAILAVTFPLIYYFFKRTLKRALDYSYHFSVWHILWIIPIFNNVLYSLLFSPYISNYDATPDPSFYYTPPIWVILTFATYTMILWVAIISGENAQLSEKLHLSEVVLLTQQKQAEKMQEQIEATSRMRHDICHHIVVMDAYIKSRDLDGLDAYMQEYRNVFPDAPAIYCDRLAINSLLGYYQEIATKNNTHLEVSIALSETADFPDLDLCSVLANLLENAIEACSRMESENRFIDFKLSSQSDSILAIVIENSYEGEIEYTNGVFTSSKAKDRKGIGISSVQNIVEQYHGITKFEYQDNVFKASVLMRASAE